MLSKKDLIDDLRRLFRLYQEKKIDEKRLVIKTSRLLKIGPDEERKNCSLFLELLEKLLLSSTWKTSYDTECDEYDPSHIDGLATSLSSCLSHTVSKVISASEILDAYDKPNDPLSLELFINEQPYTVELITECLCLEDEADMIEFHLKNKKISPHELIFFISIYWNCIWMYSDIFNCIEGCLRLSVGHVVPADFSINFQAFLNSLEKERNYDYGKDFY